MSELEGAVRSPSKWIISPAADLALLVATPLAIVPLVALISQQVSAEVIFLYVAAFASIGHHLPGFLRAYGDRELFRRFRWRFLLAPVVALGVALSFSWSQLHGLELLLLGWATWHILMQTYGFMRIYDAKAGSADATSAWLDFLLCAAIFTAGIVFSQARVLGIVEALALVGIPIPASSWLTALQISVGVVAGVVLALSIAHAIRQGVRGKINPVKWLLVLSTAWLYWISGSLSTNLLVGVAMFEIFHALQYYAIVWSFNHRRARLAGDQFGPLAVLFGDAWWCLACYVAAIAAFGSLRLMSAGMTDFAVQHTLLAVLAASTMLHFYFDGFIWKVRERETQVNLGIDASNSSAISAFRFAHGARWAVLLMGVVLLFGLEYRRRTQGDAQNPQWLAQLASWAPELPEMQVRQSSAALQRGDVPHAVEQARRAVAQHPRSPAAQAALGSALLQRGDYSDAAMHLRQAVELGQPQWENQFDLGQALARCGDLPAAEAAFTAADKLQPRSSRIQLAWADAIARCASDEEALPKYRLSLTLDPRSPAARSALVRALGKARLYEEAISIAQAGVAAAPKSAVAHLDLGQAYFADQNFATARDAFASAVALAPKMGEAHYHLGAAQVQCGELSAAIDSLQQALRFDEEHGSACFQLANAYYLSGELERAAKAYHRCSELMPQFPDAWNNRGAVLFELGDLAAAAEAYAEALRLEPDRGDSHYNLALVLLSQGDLAAARVHAVRAKSLGIASSEEVNQALGL